MEREVPIEVVNVEGVRFTVPGCYGDQEIGGHRSWPDFAGAVAAARSTIKRFDYPGVKPDHTFSRAFVALRVSSKYAQVVNMTSGIDREVLRWEVFRDRVVIVPSGQGGLSNEQASVSAVANVYRA